MTTSSKADEHERDLAVTNDAALVRYQSKWARNLVRMMRAHPARWRVPGLSDDEVRDALTLRLIEVVRGPLEAHAHFERPGREWGLAVMEEQLRTLRKRFRLDYRPTDLSEAPLLEREPNPEDRWLEAETDACRTLAARNAREGLSRPQRRWLAAMTMAANGGEFFAASDRLNLSAASRQLGKDRSSAQRAFKELQARFQRERDRFG